MTKTKRQLRAEAVERLVKLGEVGFYYEIIDALCDADCDDWSGDKVASTIRDLLTDDDSIIQEVESTIELLSDGADSREKLEATAKVTTMPLKMPDEIKFQYTDGSEHVRKLAGDSREKLEAEASELVADYAVSGNVCDALYHGITALLDRQAAITRAECDKPNWDYCETCELQDRVDELTAENDFPMLRRQMSEVVKERDGWKAKAEQAEHAMNKAAAESRNTTKQPISQFDVPKSEETTENVTSKDEIRNFDDTREKLEADIWYFIEHNGWFGYEYEAESYADCRKAIFEIFKEWLDRQAAITANEANSVYGLGCEACRAAQKRRIAELTTERDLYREKLSRALDHAHEIERLMS